MDEATAEKVNRNKVVPIRVTTAEKQKIEYNAGRAGLDTSEFLRRLGTETELKPPLSPEERRLLIGITNNLNQVVRRANSGHSEAEWLPQLQSLLTRLDEYFV